MADTRTYDLMLVISSAADDARRAKIRADADALIAAGGGQVVAEREWGDRPLAFDIDHEPRGEYRLVEFTGPGDLPQALTRQLRITDGVLRARVTHTVPGAELPEGPRPAPAPAAASPAAAPPATAAAPPAAPAAPEASAPPPVATQPPAEPPAPEPPAVEPPAVEPAAPAPDAAEAEAAAEPSSGTEPAA